MRAGGVTAGNWWMLLVQFVFIPAALCEVMEDLMPALGNRPLRGAKWQLFNGSWQQCVGKPSGAACLCR